MLTLVMISCKSLTQPADYFGQSFPDTIPVIFAPNVISKKGRLEHGISFTPNAQELAFGILNKEDFSGEIFYSSKIKDKWTEPAVFQPLKAECVYLPYFSPDGKSMLYAQSKSDTDNTETDIWMINKINDNWRSPKLIPAPVNSASREANACMAYDGTIYFSSNRNCDGKENCHTAELFYTKLADNAYQSVNAIAALISPNDKESVFISPRQEYVIFCSYTDNETGVDLYISYRDVNHNWIEPQLIDASINSKDWDRRPFVTIDNKFLFFTRLQISEESLTESDIFWVNTSKLFKPFVYHALADTTLKAGEEFEIAVPKDYFKDIDDNQLTYRINQTQFNWLNFDSEQMKLSGLPTMEGDFELTFTATDKSSNTTNDKVVITVKK